MIEKTADGSDTVRSSTFAELYHSSHGALQESIHVFIDSGLTYFSGQSEIRILEYGFGTGLNAALAWIWSERQTDSRVSYLGLEAYPLPRTIWEELNYSALLQFPDLGKMHMLPWDVDHPVSDNFVFRKKEIHFENYQGVVGVDLIFYDAFAPGAQPELWLRPHLDRVIGNLRPGGCLITYCAKGSFKRALKELGCRIEELEGPPGKRQITRAHKSS